MLPPMIPLQAELVFVFLFVIIPILVTLVVALLWLGVAYWVYTDAQKHDVDSPILWALLTFLIGLFGLVIYLIVRD